MPEQSLALVAALLRRGREIDRLSAALTLLAIGLGLYQAVQGIGWRYFAAAMLAIAMLGLWQKYWALRVALDAELFERFSRAGDRLEAQTQDLDRALADLGLARADAAGAPGTSAAAAPCACYAGRRWPVAPSSCWPCRACCRSLYSTLKPEESSHARISRRLWHHRRRPRHHRLAQPLAATAPTPMGLVAAGGAAAYPAGGGRRLLEQGRPAQLRDQQGVQRRAGRPPAQRCQCQSARTPRPRPWTAAIR